LRRRQQIELDATPRDVVEDLVAGDAFPARQCVELLQIGDVEVADAPVPDLSGGAQLGESFDDDPEVLALSPMQQIEIDAVDLQSSKTLLARGDDLLAAGGIRRQDLRDDEYLITPALDRLGDQSFGGAIAIHLGCVYQLESELDAESQRGQLGLALLPLFA
jgi:hypothetical protein